MSVEYLAQGFILAAQVLASVSLATIGMSRGEAVNSFPAAAVWNFEFYIEFMEFRNKPGWCQCSPYCLLCNKFAETSHMKCKEHIKKISNPCWQSNLAPRLQTLAEAQACADACREANARAQVQAQVLDYRRAAYEQFQASAHDQAQAQAFTERLHSATEEFQAQAQAVHRQQAQTFHDEAQARAQAQAHTAWPSFATAQAEARAQAPTPWPSFATAQAEAGQARARAHFQPQAQPGGQSQTLHQFNSETVEAAVVRINKTTSDEYVRLGVARDATQETIKQAWKQVLLKLHPDKLSPELKDREDIKMAIQNLNNAYDTVVRNRSRRRSFAPWASSSTAPSPAADVPAGWASSPPAPSPEPPSDHIRAEATRPQQPPPPPKGHSRGQIQQLPAPHQDYGFHQSLAVD